MPVGERDMIGAYQESVSYWATRNAKACAQWAHYLQGHLKGNNFNTHLFAISMWGVVGEMHDSYEDHLSNLLNGLGCDRANLSGEIAKISDANMRTYLNTLVEIDKNLKTIKHVFSDDELQRLRFWRHCAAHPIISAYGITLKKGKNSSLKFQKTDAYDTFMKFKDEDELDFIVDIRNKMVEKKELIDLLYALLQKSLRGW